MGAYWSSSVALSPTDLSKNILIELENTRIERELAIAQIMEHRRQIYKLAEEREKFGWSLAIGAVLVASAAFSSFHHKNLLHLLPLGPTATYLGYKAHFCYGDKTASIRKSCDRMLTEDVDSISLSPITVSDVRQRMEGLRLHRHEDDFFK